MKYTNWKPFMMFGAIIAVIFFIGVSFLAMTFSSSGDAGLGIPPGGWRPGMWGLGPFGLIFPCFGFVMMLFIIFFFFRMMTGEGGPMSGMMGHTHDPQSRSRVSRDEPQDTCPACESPIQAGWRVCPHCGQQLANKNV